MKNIDYFMVVLENVQKLQMSNILVDTTDTIKTFSTT